MGKRPAFELYVFEAEHWRARADEIRTAASVVTDKEYRDRMYSIADKYDLLASNVRRQHEQQREHVVGNVANLRLVKEEANDDTVLEAGTTLEKSGRRNTNNR